MRVRSADAHQVCHQFLNVAGFIAISNKAGNAPANRETSHTKKSRPTQKNGHRKTRSIRPSIFRPISNEWRNAFADRLIWIHQVERAALEECSGVRIGVS